MSDVPTTPVAAPSWRFSIRSLLIITAVVSVLLAPFHWLGVGYLFNIIFSSILIGTSVSVRHTSGLSTAAIISAVGILVSFPAMFLELMIVQGLSGTPFLAGVANFAACLICIPFKPKTLIYTSVLCIAGLVPYAIVIPDRYVRYRELVDLAKTYPLESLETRLAFDQEIPLARSSQKPQLSSAVDASLVDFEQRSNHHYYRRAWALERLHDETYQRFTIAENFGALRMGYLSKRDIQPPRREQIKLPIQFGRPKTPTPLIYEEVHAVSITNSFNPDMLGFSPSRRTTAGFEPHGPVDLEERLNGIRPYADHHLQLVRLELVGLLKHDKPRVYIAETIPLMNELETLPHRSLNAFEAQSLPQLATERDTVIKETSEGAVMLGAVRAGNDCLQCHNGPRGRLLGAFSYEFRGIAESANVAE